MSKSSYEIGREFENRFAKQTGCKLTPGSGNKWFAKLDAYKGRFLFSLKRTTKSSFSVNESVIRDLRNGSSVLTNQSDLIGALCISVDNVGDFVVLELDDFMSIVKDTDGDYSSFKPSKSEAKFSSASKPFFLKDSDE